MRGEQSVMAHLARLQLCLSRGCYLATAPRTNCSCHSRHSPGVDLAASQHPPPQNCYAGSLTFSWPIPVRGAHHGKGVRYCALYSVHTGVPVGQNQVSHRTLCITSGCIIEREVVPNRMSYAG